MWVWGRKDRARGLPLPSLDWDMKDSFPQRSRALATTREGVRHALHAGE
jgi:hypothetical protein